MSVFLWSLALTVVIELAVFAWLISNCDFWRVSLLVGANLMSHPVVWLLHSNSIAGFWTLEVFVIVVEALVLAFAFDKSTSISVCSLDAFFDASFDAKRHLIANGTCIDKRSFRTMLICGLIVAVVINISSCLSGWLFQIGGFQFLLSNP